MSQGQHLLLIRHGETVGNLEQIAHGQTESPLNDRGIRQAESTAQMLREWKTNYHHVYTSPLSRANHTGRLIAQALSLPVSIHEDIMEGNLGVLEEVTYQELDDFGFARRSVKDDDFDGHGGESPNQLGRRMVDAIADIRSRHSNENVIVVSHGAAISHFLAQTLGTKPAFGYQYMMHNAAVTELHWPGDAPPNMKTLNYFDHLPDELKSDSHRPDRNVRK